MADALRVFRQTISAHGLTDGSSPVLLMVSGGSDSTALAYLAADLRECGELGPLAMLHVNHKLRGVDSDADARFAENLASLLGIPFFSCEVNVAGLVEAERGNLEAVARRERYAAADEALRSLCLHEGEPVSTGRVFTAHSADDRVETFYMRSIVGTGPGGFRSMKYLNGRIARPCLDLSRDDLRAYLEKRREEGRPHLVDEGGDLWREDATNSHTDRFRSYVRHEIVPCAKERNPRLTEVLSRTMNLIADEDDYLEAQASKLFDRCVAWESGCGDAGVDYGAGCVLSPELGKVHVALRRRVCARVLGLVLGPDARIETASVDAVLRGFDPSGVSGTNGGYVTNVQGNLAVSANKRGIRIEQMAAFRTRRNRI